MPNTIHLLDSFDFYPVAEITRHWTNHTGSCSIGAFGRNGTNGARMSSTGGGISKTISAGEGTHYFGFSFKQSSIGVREPILELVDAGSATVQVTLQIGTVGKVEVWRGPGSTFGGGTLLGTGTTIFSPGTERHISAKIVISDTVGEAIVKVNGITEINLSSQDTKQHASIATADFLGICTQGFTNTINLDFDDFWWNNYADWGDVRIEALFPSGAGATTNFTASAGANWQCVDDNPPNNDTDYVSSATPGDIDTYGFTNLTPTSGAIKAVGIHVLARKDDAGVRTIAPVWRDSGVNNVGANQNIGTSYLYYTQYYEKNPQTAADATITEVNADEYGVKEVA